MKDHIDNLRALVPDLNERSVLDLGSGRGKFLIECARQGIQAKGLETSKNYIDDTLSRANEFGVLVDVVEGIGEDIPFTDSSFGFVNMSEVIEHVKNPNKVMTEVLRVLESGGKVYISVPSRFSFKDPHFHLYFVNWLPRPLAESFIGIFGKHKNYDTDTGFQRLTELHYYTRKQAIGLFSKIGFRVRDIRVKKINKIKNPIIRYLAFFAYMLVNQIYFETFHFLLEKK